MRTQPPPTGRRRFALRPSTITVGAVVLLLLITFTATGGFAGFVLGASLTGLVSGIYTLVSGRRGWASIPGRKVAAIVLAASFVITIADAPFLPKSAADSDSAASTSVSSHSPTPAPTPSPSYAFTAESAVDPAVVTEPAESAAVAIADSSRTDSTALALLDTLQIKGKAPKTGYDRTGMFGRAWIDEDRNGCDTRNDVLSRDLTGETMSGTCRVMSGTLVSPYTGATIHFVRGELTSAAVQIDHVVALGNAWQTGAQQLSQAQRIALANDPINLFAVDGRSNEQKSDGDTATWLPSAKSFRCTYVSHQISVKATYALWVTQAEHDAMARVLGDCSGEHAVSSPFAPAPAPAPVVVAAPVAAAPAPVKAAPAPAPAPVKAAPAPVAPVAPVAPPAAAGSDAMAQCKDGTLSYSLHHQGTCSHHGGVAIWYH